MLWFTVDQDGGRGQARTRRWLEIAGSLAASWIRRRVVWSCGSLASLLSRTCAVVTGASSGYGHVAGAAWLACAADCRPDKSGNAHDRGDFWVIWGTKASPIVGSETCGSGGAGVVPRRRGWRCWRDEKCWGKQKCCRKEKGGGVKGQQKREGLEGWRCHRRESAAGAEVPQRAEVLKQAEMPQGQKCRRREKRRGRRC